MKPNSNLSLFLQFQVIESMPQVLRRFLGSRVKSVMILLVQSLPDLPVQLALVAEEVPAKQHQFKSVCSLYVNQSGNLRMILLDHVINGNGHK